MVTKKWLAETLIRFHKPNSRRKEGPIQSGWSIPYNPDIRLGFQAELFAGKPKRGEPTMETSSPAIEEVPETNQNQPTQPGADG